MEYFCSLYRFLQADIGRGSSSLRCVAETQSKIGRTVEPRSFAPDLKDLFKDLPKYSCMRAVLLGYALTPNICIFLFMWLLGNMREYTVLAKRQAMAKDEVRGKRDDDLLIQWSASKLCTSVFWSVDCSNLSWKGTKISSCQFNAKLTFFQPRALSWKIFKYRMQTRLTQRDNFSLNP